MIPALILALGLTFFPGQPHWYELDTNGVEWTAYSLVEEVDYAVATPTCGAPLTADEYARRQP